MLDMRIIAVGAMALLMAAYGATNALQPRATDKGASAVEITGSIKKSARLTPERVGAARDAAAAAMPTRPGVEHVDGFDLAPQVPSSAASRP